MMLRMTQNHKIVVSRRKSRNSNFKSARPGVARLKYASYHLSRAIAPVRAGRLSEAMISFILSHQIHTAARPKTSTLKKKIRRLTNGTRLSEATVLVLLRQIHGKANSQLESLRRSKTIKRGRTSGRSAGSAIYCPLAAMPVLKPKQEGSSAHDRVHEIVPTTRLITHIICSRHLHLPSHRRH
jgi:hypothetical protein